MSCKCGKMVIITIIFVLGLITGFLLTLFMFSNGSNKRTIEVNTEGEFRGGNDGITVESITISGPEELLYDDYVAEYYRQQGGLIPAYVADKAVMAGLSLLEKIVSSLFKGMQNNLFALNLFGEVMLNSGRARQMDGIIGNNKYSSIMEILASSLQYSELIRRMIDWGVKNIGMKPLSLINSARSWISKINFKDFVSLPKLGVKIIVYTLIDIYKQYKPHLIMWFQSFRGDEIFALERAFAVGGKCFVDVGVMMRELVPALLDCIRPDNIEQICDIIFMENKKNANPEEILNGIDTVASELDKLMTDAGNIVAIAKRMFRKQEFNDPPCKNLQEFVSMGMKQIGYQRQFQY